MRRWLLVALLLLVIPLTGCGTKSAPSLAINAEPKGEGLVIYVKTTNFTNGKDGHVHIRLDGGEEAMIYGSTYTIPKVDPGAHSIFAELSNSRHEPLGVQQTIEVEVKR